jgi:hypothetical protein
MFGGMDIGLRPQTQLTEQRDANMNQQRIIFISHTHRDAELADKLRLFVEASLKLLDAQVFCSSSNVFVPNYKADIATQVKDGLIATAAAFVLLTPHSLNSHWVMFEAGAVYVRGQMIIPILTPELSYDDLPAALKGRLCIETSNADAAIKLENAIRAISTEFGFSETTGGGRRAALDGFLDACRHWYDSQQAAGSDIELLYLVKRGGVEQILGSARIGDSPFEFRHLLRQCRQKLFVAGQNLYFLTCGPNAGELHDLVRDFIGSGRAINFMICDPEFEPHIPTWSAAVGADGYRAHLRQSLEAFTTWAKDLPRMEVRLTKFIPTSMTFMDPDARNNDGLLVFTPHAFRPETALRPCFALSRRRHKEIFDEYWNYYQQVWIDLGGRTRVLPA